MGRMRKHFQKIVRGRMEKEGYQKVCKDGYQGSFFARHWREEAWRRWKKSYYTP